MLQIVILIIFAATVLLFLVILTISAFFIFDLILPAPYVASKTNVVEKMVKLAQIKKADRVFDLGSGDGRLLIAAAKRGAVAVGVEKNPFLVFLSRIKIKIARVNAKVFYGDVADLDLTKANIVFLYLNPKVLAKISPKFKQELKTGAKIISNTYELSGFTLYKKSDNILFYQVAGKK